MKIQIDKTGFKVIKESLKTQHAQLNKKMEKTNSDRTIRNIQKKKRSIRDVATEKLNIDRAEVNNWE